MPSLSMLTLINSVDIYPAIRGQDRDGGVLFTYADSPSQLGVPCSCQQRDVEQVVDEQNRITEVQNYHVFFTYDPGVRPRDKMTYMDSRGVTRTLFVGATKNEGGRNDVFTVRAIEKL